MDSTIISLREVQENDIVIFFDHQQDADTLHMAAFTPKAPTDAAASQAHWERILADSTVIARTIIVEGAVAGHIASGVPETPRRETAAQVKEQPAGS